MARHDPALDTAAKDGDSEDSGQQADGTFQGFPESAAEDKPGKERKYTLDRIEKTIGSIL